MNGPSSVKLATVAGFALASVSLVLYVVLQTAVAAEQAESPGTKSLGVALLGMMIGLPMLLAALGSALSLVIAATMALWKRHQQPQN